MGTWSPSAATGAHSRSATGCGTRWVAGRSRRSATTGAGACGGCDTAPARDGGLGEVFRLAGALAAGGHDVLLEGLFLSGDHQRSAELAGRHPLHVLLLDTPVERCARNLVARRRVGRRALRPLVAVVVAARRRGGRLRPPAVLGRER